MQSDRVFDFQLTEVTLTCFAPEPRQEHQSRELGIDYDERGC